MTTEKIADLPEFCRHAEHSPPTHMVYEPGIWRHTCPGCGLSITFTVPSYTAQPGWTKKWMKK